ncbi:hypothetical protein [Lichenibacterium dinghuense]|uniref:hypothetical protein n=1 Tax=Lichenibacterium dinghuense TaxID=2895977 RepID=UPI001F307F64|nr:hypothetical protein [Lichenibacterium sp. 6Y81]
MSRRRPHLVCLDGVGIGKPSTTRTKALRSRGWWSRRLGCDLDVVRLRDMVPS